MFALIAAALLGWDGPPASGPDVRQAYDRARAAAGRTPDDQVRLAYWCEAHGLAAERLRHLAQAVLADPDHAAARGLLGLVARQDRWARPDAVADQVRADPTLLATLAEYDARRSATPYTADGQWTLARWADEHGLEAQARAHYTAVVRLDPRRDAAWKKLGYKKHDGRWATDAELAAARVDADAQKAADKRWKPLLEKWRAQLGRPAQRGEAEANLRTVTDPRAVRSIEQAFLDGGTAHQAVALETLAQVDSAAASRLITRIAILGADPNVRRAAVETLRRRDPRDYADLLIRSLRERLAYEVQPVAGVGTVGKLLIKEPQRKVQRLYSTPAVPNYLAWLAQQADGAPTLTYSYQGQRVVDTESTATRSMEVADTAARHRSNLRIDDYTQANLHSALANMEDLPRHPADHTTPHSAPRQTYTHRVAAQITTHTTTMTPLETQTTIPLAAMIAEYQKSAVAAQQQLARDVALIDDHNRRVDATNDRLAQILRAVSGEDHGADIPAWTGWMLNLSGYAITDQATTDVPTYSVDVPLAYQPQNVPIIQDSFAGPSQVTRTQSAVVQLAGDCFGAGTLVRTMTGPRPIESLRIGDLVLSQSTTTGALRYQPILLVHHNPPSPTYRVRLGTDTIVTSPVHRFWKVGQGWVMARDIQVGDRLRLLDGTALVDRFEPGAVQPVFNLDIAEDADFFAGGAAVLVHDNTLLDSRLIPFDLPAADVGPVAAAR